MPNRIIALTMLAILLPCRTAFAASQTITEFGLDASGNTTRIESAANTQPPTVTSLDPNAVRRIATNRITAYGSNLKNATVSAAAEGFQIAVADAQLEQVVFDLTAAETVIPGDYTLNFTTGLGTAAATLTISPELPPELQASPNPIVIWGSGLSANVQFTLSAPDSVDNTLYLSVADPSVAQVSPAQILLKKGETANSQTVAVTGLAAGQTELSVNASQLNALKIPLQVVQLQAGDYSILSATLGIERPFPPAAHFKADNAYAPAVGIVRATPVAAAPLQADNAYAQIGLFWGTTIDTVTPTLLLAGSNNPLNLFGENLQLVTQIAVDPADGAIVDPAWEVSADGRQLTVHVTIAAGTPAATRKLVVTGSKGPALFAQPGGDSVEIQ